MAFELPALPNFQTTVPQQIAAMPTPMDQYAKMLQLRTLLGQANQQEQLQPLQLQEAQQELSTKTMQNEQMRTELDSRKAMMKAIASGDLNKYVASNDAADQPGGFDATGAYQHLVSTGVLPTQAQEWVGGFQKIAQNDSEIKKNLGAAQKDFLETRDKAHQQLAESLSDIQVLPDKEQAGALDALKSNYLKNPPPGLTRQDLALLNQADVAHLPGLAGMLDLHGRMEAYNTKQQQQAADLAKTDLLLQPPSKDQLATFTTKTIPSFVNLSQAQKNSLTTQAGQARTMDEFNKVLERADATDKAEQMHRDSLAATAALRGQAFAQKGVEDNDKVWTDPQHGYLAVKSQINATLNSLKAGVDGNGLAASMGPTMVVLGVNGFNQTHRISPAEAEAAGMPGGYAERFNAWADKAFKGKLSPQVADEGTQILTELQDQAYSRALDSSRMLSAAHNVPNMTVFDKTGNLTTLDKVKNTQSSSAAGGGKVLTQAAIEKAAKDHNLSVDEVTRQAKAQGYAIKP